MPGNSEAFVNPYGPANASLFPGCLSGYLLFTTRFTWRSPSMSTTSR